MSTHFRDAPPAERRARIDAFCALSSAASRHIDLRYAAAGTPPGSPERVAAADARTSLDDRRIARSLTLPGVEPRHLTSLGLIRSDVFEALGLGSRAR